MAANKVKVLTQGRLVSRGCQTIGNKIYLDLDSDETVKVEIDWTGFLEGDTIASQTNEANGPTVTSVLATPLVTLTLSGGGGTVEHRITTNTGAETKELFIIVNEREDSFDYGIKG